MKLGKWAQQCCVMLVAAGCLVGQTVSSSITGTVLDPASAVVPNAAVTLTDENTGAGRSTTTDGSGVFRFLNVNPSSYKVSIELTGFKSLVQTNILVSANETRDVGKLGLAL